MCDKEGESVKREEFQQKYFTFCRHYSSKVKADGIASHFRRALQGVSDGKK